MTRTDRDTPGHQAVAEALARIMRRRHPGTSWAPVRADSPPARDDQTVVRLGDLPPAKPEDKR